jgi:hypothetical protein
MERVVVVAFGVLGRGGGCEEQARAPRWLLHLTPALAPPPCDVTSTPAHHSSDGLPALSPHPPRLSARTRPIMKVFALSVVLAPPKGSAVILSTSTDLSSFSFYQRGSVQEFMTFCAS